MPHYPDPSDQLMPQSQDVILQFQSATHAHQKAQAHVAQLHAQENELQDRLSAMQRKTAEMSWSARASQALSVCEAERCTALADKLQAASAEPARLELTTADDIHQLEALEDAKMALAGRIGTAKTVALQQVLRELDAAGLDPVADEDIAAARQVDQLYQFGAALRPEQRDNELLRELFAAHVEVQEMFLSLDADLGRHFPELRMLEVEEIDHQISECALETYELTEIAYRRLADTTRRKAESLVKELAMARDNLREAQKDLADKASALSDTTAALQQFMRMAAAAPPAAHGLDSMPDSGRLAAIREDEQDLIFDVSANATMTGMPTEEAAAWQPH